MTKKNPAAQALGKLGRAKNTPAQQAAARANGAKGGRPKKINPGYWCKLHKPNDAIEITTTTKAKCQMPGCTFLVAYED